MTFRSVILTAEKTMLGRLAQLDIDLSLRARHVRETFTKLVEDPLTNMILSKGNYPVQPFTVYLLHGVRARKLVFFPMANENLLKLLVGVSEDVPLDLRTVLVSLKNKGRSYEKSE